MSRPSYLIRAFANEEYYLAFLKGKFRMRPLCYYRKIEGHPEREDELEGIGKVTVNGVTCTISEAGMMFFILCASAPDADTEEMGKYRARISDPDKLVSLIIDFISSKPEYRGRLVNVQLQVVNYTKDDGLYPDHTNSPLDSNFIVIASQKPKTYENEKEWRIVCSFTIGAVKAQPGESGEDVYIDIELDNVNGIIEPYDKN